MAQVQRSAHFIIHGREVGALTTNQNRKIYEGTSEATEFGTFRKRRLSGEIGERDHCPDQFENYTSIKPKRVRVHGCFSNDFGGDTLGQDSFEVCNFSTELDELDCPRYSERHLEQALMQVRHECSKSFSSKENELNGGISKLMNELNQTQQENRILKRAINIQSNRCKELEIQLKRSQDQEVSAAAYIKRLEQEVYALGLRVRQIGPYNENAEMDFTERRPPDVY